MGNRSHSSVLDYPPAIGRSARTVKLKVKSYNSLITCKYNLDKFKIRIDFKTAQKFFY